MSLVPFPTALQPPALGATGSKGPANWYRAHGQALSCERSGGLCLLELETGVLLEHRGNSVSSPVKVVFPFLKTCAFALRFWETCGKQLFHLFFFFFYPPHEEVFLFVSLWKRSQFNGWR